MTGLSVDTFSVNILGHSCYTVSCLVFLYSGTVRRQYRRRWGAGVGDPTVRVNDLASTVCVELIIKGSREMVKEGPKKESCAQGCPSHNWILKPVVRLSGYY